MRFTSTLNEKSDNESFGLANLDVTYRYKDYGNKKISLAKPGPDIAKGWETNIKNGFTTNCN